MFSGFTCYFFFIAAFLWLSVLCFDIWINFKDHCRSSTPSKNRIRFLWYSLYAWGTAVILTTLAMWCQWSDSISDQYKPGIGYDVCWLDSKYCRLKPNMLWVYKYIKNTLYIIIYNFLSPCSQ